MDKNKETVVNIFNHEIIDFAYFEDRRYHKSFSKRFIFIRKKYLKDSYPLTFFVTNDYSSSISPISLPENERELFISLSELKDLVQNETYNLILKDLLLRSDGFDQINIVFDHIFEFKEFNEDTINSIIHSITTSWVLKNSFQVKNKMPAFVYNNIHLIKPIHIWEFINSFPNPVNLITEESRNNHKETIAKIKMTLGDNSNTHHPERKNYSQKYHSNTLSNEINAGMDELKKWDSEDSSWRIANDLD
jgi:hypothetical protein